MVFAVFRILRKKAFSVGVCTPRNFGVDFLKNLVEFLKNLVEFFEKVDAVFF